MTDSAASPFATSSSRLSCAVSVIALFNVTCSLNTPDVAFTVSPFELKSIAFWMHVPSQTAGPAIHVIGDACWNPGAPDAFDRTAIAEAIAAVGLPALTTRLDEDAHWNQMLSLGEQQRLGVARALLHRPDYLFLDEATASLDEPSEAALYRLLEMRLPATTVVSIGHRGTLHAFHRRNVTLQKSGDRYELAEAQPAPVG